MFVDVESPKSPLKIANILMAYDKGVVIKGVRQPKEKLSPKVCFDILKSTNHPRCIQNMLQLIAKLPDDEQAEFKEVVIAAFDNREQPVPILQLGRELAKKSGYGIEFTKAQKINDGYYLFSEADARKSMVSTKSHFTDEDFSAYDKVIFLSDKKIQFDADVKFPKNMEIPNSSEVSFYDEKKNEGGDLHGVQGIRFKEGAKVILFQAANLPENLDFSCCDVVDLSYCSLEKQPHLCFKDGAKVDLSNAYNFPENIDFSCCDKVNLNQCNLRGMQSMRFKEGAKVILQNAYNLSENLDFSMCSKVDLSECNLREQPHLRFKDGAKVDLSNAYNLPENLDFSMCSKVNLSGCNLKGQPNLRFNDGAKVILSDAYNLSENLDFSMCSEVDLTDCDLNSVKELIFKNRKQMEKSSAKLSDGWKGKLVFADEQPEPPSLGLAMGSKAKGGR